MSIIVVGMRIVPTVTVDPHFVIGPFRSETLKLKKSYANSLGSYDIG